MPQLRLLVIDDDPLQLELVGRALSHDGFEVRGASTAAEIHEIATSFTPELVLVDVNMPELPNERAVEVVRAAMSSARLVLYSAWEATRLRALMGTLGADGYASKSDSVFELGARLRSLCS
jgi:DNA-binding response OmpR family regulator